jgi:hypothetical protein
MDQHQLTKKLRKIISDIEAEPIPARFRKLLGLDDPDRPPPGTPGMRVSVPMHDEEPIADSQKIRASIR